MRYNGVESPLHGWDRGESEADVSLQSGERIHGVELAISKWGNGADYIHAIRLSSNLATHGWYGGHDQAYKVESVCLVNSRLAYLAGAGGSNIDRFEVYFNK